jgi:hypothetical protein
LLFIELVLAVSWSFLPSEARAKKLQMEDCPDELELGRFRRVGLWRNSISGRDIPLLRYRGGREMFVVVGSPLPV